MTVASGFRHDGLPRPNGGTGAEPLGNFSEMSVLGMVELREIAFRPDRIGYLTSRREKS